MNYGELNPVLDGLEPLLLRLAGEKRLMGATAERWRWDEPTITLTWVDRGTGIGKNIGLSIVDDPPSTVTIEVNAWLDKDRNEGATRVRQWQNQIVGTVPVRDLEAVETEVQRAYEIVFGWREDNLRRSPTVVRAP